ncbi:unnamed protein product [Rhizoctonia solani]|uniref:UDENN domain-containing protein n=1 Tax=Rhizoctonia solani TaxID=456999 RepID=A0A8H3BRY7_9AGAM|nr:unnamed protein product [Rhizoctonia solani]CAE6462146.1 unnamed protein product [Rhizoctonia solani]
MEEDASGDIGLSSPFRPSKELNPTLKSKSTRRVPPAISLPPNNLSNWKTPSPASPTILSPTTPTAKSLSPASPSSRVSRSRTMPRLSSRLEHHIRDLFSEDTEALPTDKIPQLNRWVLSVAVVDFDLDIGPVVAKLYPGIKLDALDRENIAFSSFPDTTLFDTGTQNHSFKIRLSQSIQIISGDSTRDLEVLYGYASFMQRKDPTSKRGYLQRSVVFLTHLPWVGLFDKVISIFGPMFFTHGNTMLQSGCLNICNWPDPTLGSSLELGLLGSAIMAEIPRSNDEQQTVVSAKLQNNLTIATLPPQSILPLLVGSIDKLWTLWECLVLSDPILVFAPSPLISSAVVWWLRDLIRPVPFAGDIRPYFHIHDRDFPVLVTKNAPRPGLIMGVTNPYFENVCKHWPHILSVGQAEKAPRPSSASKHSAALASQALGPTPGYHTNHNRYISKDRALLKRLEAAIKEGPAAQSQMMVLLRQHFAQRSQQLLTPLNRYFSNLLPKPTDSSHPARLLPHASSSSLHAPSPSPSHPLSSGSSVSASPALRPTTVSPAPSSVAISDIRVKPFNSKDFFASLKTHGAQLPFRSAGKQKEFYERWLKSPAFGAWISGRVDAAQSVLSRAGNE